MKIRIGSRGSDLALWQAHYVKDQLTALGHQVEIIIITTKGDRIQDLSFDKMEGKGFFTKEIEEALLNNEVDLAVHSHKDLETTNPEGLIIGAVSYREDPTDILLIRQEVINPADPLKLKENAVVGTSSARRKTQLLRLRSDLHIKDLRGNVPTRVRKLLDGQYDAIVLASAGISRLNLDLTGLETHVFHPHQFVPAPAQGVLGLQIRETDDELKAALQDIHNADVASMIKIERDVLKKMEGGCQLPLGVYCEFNKDDWSVYVSYSNDSQTAATISKYTAEKPDGLADKIVSDLKNGV